jgi:lon-related putative ATP-dependent protease
MPEKQPKAKAKTKAREKAPEAVATPNTKLDLPVSFKSTEEIGVSDKLIEQVIGQDTAVDLMRKAAVQKRNVLLIGVPGIGKSMLAQAMAEILPVSRLYDILIYPNEEDPNNPRVRVVQQGEGKQILNQTRLEAKKQEDNMRLLSLLFPIGWFLLSYLAWTFGWISDIIYAATLILGGMLMFGFAIGTQMNRPSVKLTPKLLVDNLARKVAPFAEGTGARSGSLLGDVRHDPLQCHYGFNMLYIRQLGKNGFEMQEKTFIELWENLYSKYKNEIIRNEKGHEAFHLHDEDKIYTLGEKNGKTVWSRVLSLNRQPFEGQLVDIRVGENVSSFTPEHNVVLPKGGRKEAGKLSFFDKLLQVDIPKILAR